MISWGVSATFRWRFRYNCDQFVGTKVGLGTALRELIKKIVFGIYVEVLL